jgi:hypothetical protein
MRTFADLAEKLDMDVHELMGWQHDDGWPPDTADDMLGI